LAGAYLDRNDVAALALLLALAQYALVRKKDEAARLPLPAISMTP